MFTTRLAASDCLTVARHPASRGEEPRPAMASEVSLRNPEDGAGAAGGDAAAKFVNHGAFSGDEG